MARPAPCFFALLLALLALVQGQDDGYYEDKRGISALARNGDLPSAQNDYKRFAHPLTWRRQEEEKRVAHPMSRQTPAVREEKRFAHPLAAQWAAARDAEDEAERALVAELVDEALLELEKRMGASTLARTGALPGKRNIAAMARDGYLTQHAPRPQSEDEEAEEDGDAQTLEKRNVAALARNYSGGKRNVAQRARTLSRYGAAKRAVATLLRSRVSRQPYAFARLSGVRGDELDDALAADLEKRNIQALLKTMRPAGQPDESKRHLGSLLAGKRRKRAALHDPLEMQDDYPALSYEYEDDDASAPLREDKRFLEAGEEVVPAGEIQVQKRNIASLARLGWLPAPLRY